MKIQSINFPQLQKAIAQAEEESRKNHISHVEKFYKSVTVGKPFFGNPFSRDRSVYGDLKRCAKNLLNPKSRREKVENYIWRIDNLRDQHNLNRNEKIAKKAVVLVTSTALLIGGLYYFGVLEKIMDTASRLFRLVKGEVTIESVKKKCTEKIEKTKKKDKKCANEVHELENEAKKYGWEKTKYDKETNEYRNKLQAFIKECVVFQEASSQQEINLQLEIDLQLERYLQQKIESKKKFPPCLKRGKSLEVELKNFLKKKGELEAKAEKLLKKKEKLEAKAEKLAINTAFLDSCDKQYKQSLADIEKFIKYKTRELKALEASFSRVNLDATSAELNKEPKAGDLEKKADKLRQDLSVKSNELKIAKDNQNKFCTLETMPSCPELVPMLTPIFRENDIVVDKSLSGKWKAYWASGGRTDLYL